MATHSSVLAWRIPGTGEPGGRAAIYGVAQSRTRLKRLSSSSSSRHKVKCYHFISGDGHLPPEVMREGSMNMFDKWRQLFDNCGSKRCDRPKVTQEIKGPDGFAFQPGAGSSLLSPIVEGLTLQWRLAEGLQSLPGKKNALRHTVL